MKKLEIHDITKEEQTYFFSNYDYTQDWESNQRRIYALGDVEFEKTYNDVHTFVQAVKFLYFRKDSILLRFNKLGEENYGKIKDS